MTRWRSIAEFLALNRNTSLLLAALVLAGLGEKLWLGFAPKYIEVLGGGVFVIGIFDALQTVLGAVYAYPGGWLTDRWGERRALQVFSVVSVAGYGLVWVWPSWPALVLGAFLFTAWSALSLPTTFTVVAKSVQRHRHTMGIGLQSLVRRVPMMLGPLVGGWLVTRFGWEHGVRRALELCVGLSVSTLVFQGMLAEPDSAGRNGPMAGPRPAGGPPLAAVVRSFTPALRELLVSDILIRFCERIPYAFVILWAMDYGGVTAQQFGWLVAFEMAAAMLCYIPVAHLADKHRRRPFVLVTFVFFTLFPISLLWARSFGWLALAFVVRGLKEFGEPARKALILGEAPPEGRARTYGAYYLIRDCTVTVGSFLGAWLWSLSPSANFIGAALCGGLGTIWFWRRGERKADHRSHSS